MNCINDIATKFFSGEPTEERLRVILNDYEITPRETAIVPAADDTRRKAAQMFIVTKRVEGCTDSTIKYYVYVIRRFMQEIGCELEKIGADQIRYYIAVRSTRDKLSKVSQDNELRVLKSFFGWCAAEDYVQKDPTAGIKAVKKERRIKKPFSETELELIRRSAKTTRDRAIIEVLYSTGCRVSELCGMNRRDVSGDEMTVLGKGEKERVVYLNAKARLALSEYLTERTDTGEALFVTERAPHKRLGKSSVESTVKQIGRDAGVNDCHPHRFRRTAATMALNRGMPLEQVSKMLGHENIETTTIYARSEEKNVKASHRKYVV